LLFENKRFEILGAIALEYNGFFDDTMNGVEVAKLLQLHGCCFRTSFS
jgi:F-type H+-transporting ATPase subunit delta